VLEVIRRERIAPHLVRVYAGGAGFAAVRPNEFTDRYIKILFAKPELALVPPYDLAELRGRLDPSDLPVTRTYTVRQVNTAEQWLAIDFVVHGDEGLAGPWAATATPGDLIVFSGPGGGYSPDPTADWHLFAGDESALPAIAAALEALPADAEGVAFVEVYGAADEIVLEAPDGVDIRWVHRGDAAAGTSTVLADTIADFDWPTGRVQVFAHGERESMKALRAVFFDRHRLERAQVSLSGYWAYGRAEDRFQAEKREPIGQILEAAAR
jgi:NADPH-dependent ferric siderophore reductase